MGMFDALQVSASALTAERLRMDVTAENLANAESSRGADGGPYRRKDVVFTSESQTSPFSSVFQAQMDANGVAASDVIEDTREPDRRYLPGHPDADKNGYVAFPKINPAEDMVDLMGASRGYQANVAAMSAVKDMIHRSLDLMR